LVVTVPANPVATAGSALTATSFTANWSASATATSYFLDVSTSKTFATFVAGYNNLSVSNVTTLNVIGNLAAVYYYRVRASNASGASGSSNVITVNTLILSVKNEEVLFANPYPNPAVTRVTLPFVLHQPDHVKLMIFDVTGREMKIIVDEHLEAGTHKAVWDCETNVGA